MYGFIIFYSVPPIGNFVYRSKETMVWLCPKSQIYVALEIICSNSEAIEIHKFADGVGKDTFVCDNWF